MEIARGVIPFRALKSAASGDALRLRVKAIIPGSAMRPQIEENGSSRGSTRGRGWPRRTIAGKFLARGQEAETGQDFLQRTEELVAVIKNGYQSATVHFDHQRKWS